MKRLCTSSWSISHHHWGSLGRARSALFFFNFFKNSNILFDALISIKRKNYTITVIKMNNMMCFFPKRYFLKKCFDIPNCEILYQLNVETEEWV